MNQMLEALSCRATTIRSITVGWLLAFAFQTATAEQWVVPLAGNAFSSQGESNRNRFAADGTLRLRGGSGGYSVFFHVDRPGSIAIAIKGRAVGGPAQIQANVDSVSYVAKLSADTVSSYPLGVIDVGKPGYVRVALSNLGDRDSAPIEVSELIVTSETPDVSLDYVKSNEGNMFYWGRRGPSVHLSYQTPKNVSLTYAYSEITVPTGEDALGSYFMANGFGEGYFGFQVNSETERRVLFSVWSPFRTDNPADIPAEDRVLTLSKGADVRAQDFGNEGSGGQSFLIYPWEAGRTYRFLTEVKPDGNGNTRYCAWFGDKQADEWRLIAQFQRPKTDTHLTRFHSFLENFSPSTGHITRSAHYGNQWVCDESGKWYEVTRAKFTGDATARGRHRLDYAGGTIDNRFFLRNCGFFAERISLDQVFERVSTADQQPEIDFATLPR